MTIKYYVLTQAVEDTAAQGYHLGSSPDREQAVTAAKNFAAQREKPIDITAIYHDHSPRTVRYFPDGHVERIWETAERVGAIYKIKRATEVIKQDWPGFTYTGELLEVRHPSGEGVTYRVITGPYTPACACRDCGDHYIIAGYSSYRSVSKSDFSVQNDVADR